MSQQDIAKELDMSQAGENLAKEPSVNG